MKRSLHSRLVVAVSVSLPAFLGLAGITLDKAFQSRTEVAVEDRLIRLPPTLSYNASMESLKFLSVPLSTFTLIALAEIGDKSQLVCMTLAARHRHWPVILGATVAFLILNTLAVLFGAGVAAWMPERLTAGVVSVLFGAFAIHIFLNQGDGESEDVVERSGHGIFLTTLLLIFVAEFGDKTQIAVAGLASSMNPLLVWIGATAALVTISALGVWAGRTILQRIPLLWLHRISGGLFLLFAMIAAWRALA